MKHKHQPWYLINNTSHRMRKFTSEYKLRQFARQQGWDIHRSGLDRRTFYTNSLVTLPMEDNHESNP